MTISDCTKLLDSDDPGPVAIINSGGRSPFLLLGDHAGNAIPRRLGTLGLSSDELGRHIAWDIGVRATGELMAAMLDAVFVHQPYSRLVIDCNRDPASPEACMPVSDSILIAGNHALSASDRESRVTAIHRPYHDRIATILADRDSQGRATILIALHSFTPVMTGIPRPWDIGILYSGGNTSFARILLEVLSDTAGSMIGDNEPYRMDETDYTIPRHAFGNLAPYVEIEVRQDLIGDAEGQRRMGAELSHALEVALLRLG